jgi:large subunit ribosomal protein L29
MAQDKQLVKLRGMSPAESLQEEVALRDEIWKLRLQRATGQLQSPQRVRQARRRLARVLTLRREEALQQARGSKP